MKFNDKSIKLMATISISLAKKNIIDSYGQ